MATTKDKRVRRAFFFPLLLLIVPLVGNLTVTGWNWQWHDFAFAYVIWTVFGLLYVRLTKNTLSTKHKVAIGFVVFGILAVIWGILATG
jgi:hypothetical protein